jgi:hypothetical protein
MRAIKHILSSPANIARPARDVREGDPGVSMGLGGALPATAFGLRRTGLLLALALAMFGPDAQAANGPNDPLADCPSTMTEADYLGAGGKLTTISRPDLETFPPGFLNKDCHGDVSLAAIVLPNGSMALGPHDHGVTCVPEAAFMSDAATESLVWHSGVIMDRLRALRFKPPRLAGKPVCVAIRRSWRPDAPHRFLGAEGGRTWLKQK